MSAKVFCHHHNLKREDLKQQKNFWFLVTRQSNEKNKCRHNDIVRLHEKKDFLQNRVHVEGTAVVHYICLIKVDQQKL